MEEFKNIPLESALIGNMVKKPNEVLPIVIEKGLKTEDFYDDLNKKVFEYLIKKWENNEVISYTIFPKDFQDFEKYKDEIANRYLLSEILDKNEILFTVNKLKELSAKRKLYNILKFNEQLLKKENVSKILKRILEDTIEIKEFLEKDKHTKYNIGEALNKYKEEILKRKYKPSILEGLPTGFSEIDKLTGGLKGGEVIIIAGRPSMGKSAFALNIFTNLLKEGYKACFVSLEMGENQIWDRIFSSETGIDIYSIRKGNFTEEEEEKIKEFAEEIAIHWEGKVITRGVETFMDLKTIAYELKEENSLDCLIIDYLQLLKGDKKYHSRQEEVAEISRSLKILAKELDIPIVALAQLSREVEKRSDKRPLLSDLRESGSIEQDADIIMFLYRPEYYLITKNRHIPSDLKGKTEVIIAKNRQGATKTIELKFHPSIQKFEEENPEDFYEETKPNIDIEDLGELDLDF
jgi:replicative DNA helicase